MSSRYQKTSSSGLSLPEYRRLLKAGKPPAVSLFLGDELFFFRRSVTELVATVHEDFRPFNVGTFWLPDDSLESAVRTARELPFGGSRRVVAVRNLEKAFKGRIAADEDSETTHVGPGVHELLAYISDPSPSTLLVLQAAKLDGRRREVATLKRGATVIDCTPPDEAALALWARNRLKQLNVFLNREAETALMARLGNNIERLDSEIEKLATFAQGNGPLTAEDVSSIVTTEAEFAEFALSDAMLNCDAKRALSVLHRELQQGTFATPLMLLGSIATSYRRLAMARALAVGEITAEEQSRITKVRSYNKFEYTRHPFLKRMPERSCARALQRIAETDLAIKTSKGTPRLQLVCLVAELCDPKFWTSR